MPTSPSPVRIAVLNDYEIVVAGLVTLLRRFPGRVRVVEMDVRTPVLSDVDVVLVDTFALAPTEPMSLHELARTGRSAGAKVVILSWNTGVEPVQQALAQGAAGYLSKSLEADELVAALEAIHAGQVVTPRPEAGPDDMTAGCWPGQEVGFSIREGEVIGLIAKGLSNVEIGQALFLGTNTIKTYVRTAYRKMGVTRRSQAVLWALDNGYALTPARTVLGGAAAQRDRGSVRGDQPGPVA